MNTWRSRASAAAMLFALAETHSAATFDLPNSEVGMLVYHGSAATMDLILIYTLPALLAGKVCDDMQLLCLAFIVVNFVGFLLYMAFSPPIIYNTISWGLAYVQYARLFILDSDHVDSVGGNLVRRSHHLGA